MYNIEERIDLLEKALTDELARVDTLRDMLLDAIKLSRNDHQRIEKLKDRIEKLEQIRNAYRFIDARGIKSGEVADEMLAALKDDADVFKNTRVISLEGE